MNDLILAACFVAVATAGAFLAGRLVARRSRAATLVLGGGAVAAMCSYVVFLHERLAITSWLPLTGAIVLANIIPPAGLFLAGIVSQQADIPRIRRYGIVLAIGVAATSTVARYFVHTAPKPDEPWYVEDVCMQTVQSSCSAASAVSLLRFRGIQATEREMMRLCLTSAEGTPPLGLFRGLTLKSRDSGYEVRVLQKPLRDYRASDLPAVLLLRDATPAKLGGTVWDSFERQRNGHAVVLYSYTADGEAVIGDPAAGLTRWSREALNKSYQGNGLTLVKR